MFFGSKKIARMNWARTRDRSTVSRYEQLETSPETIEQELRPAVCEHRQTDIYKENYSISYKCVRLSIRV